MNSKTKRQLTAIDLERICLHHFKNKPNKIYEIISGFYATIYKLDIQDKSYVLKIAPPQDVEVLTYERDIMQREVKVYGIMAENGIPTPKVLVTDYTKKIINRDYYIMEYLKGDTIINLKDEIDDITKIRKQVMSFLAKIHKIKMEHFGYDNLEVYKDTMSDTYLDMIENIIKDAKRKEVVFPDYINRLFQLIPKFVSVLDECKTPRLLHFDLWDGNIFLHENEVIAMIDTERSFNGDPIAEFAAMFMNPCAEENRELMEYYNQQAEVPIPLDEKTELKFNIYTMYLFLLMYVEHFYRDIDGGHQDHLSWCEFALKEILKKLEQYQP